MDTLRRFSPAVVPRFSFRAPDVVGGLERVCREVGYPASIRVDQGSEFVSRELDLWAFTRGSSSTSPGLESRRTMRTPKSFNGKFRAKCLNQHWFMSLDDAVRKCEAWRRHTNEVRPHSAIGNKPPRLLVNRSAADDPPPPVEAG